MRDSDPAFFNTTSPQGADGIYSTIDDGLHLTDGSPSRNTGNNTFVPGTVTTDIAGKTRIQDTTVDMGAYEGPEGSFVHLDILANGQNGPVIVTPTDPISIEISLNPGAYAGRTADMWIAVKTPFEPPGNWYSYVYPSGWKPVKEKMILGFGMPAYPAEYGRSGIMSFMVNQEGVINEKDLGENISEIVKAIKLYPPDQSWKRLDPT